MGIEPSQVAVMARSSTIKSEIVLGENVHDDISTTQRTDLKKHATVTSILKTVASTKVLTLQIGIQDCLHVTYYFFTNLVEGLFSREAQCGYTSLHEYVITIVS